MSSAAEKEPLLSPEFLRKLEQLEIASKKILQGRMRGERRSKRRGSSVEFADHREYVVGDDLRFIDWNIMIRLDRLFIKLFEEEEDLHLHLIIDVGMSMDFGSPTKLDYAKQLAGAIAFVGLVNLDRVHLSTLGLDLRDELPPVRGRKSIRRLFDHLESIEPAPRCEFSKSMKSFAIKHPGKKVVVLISDMMHKEGFETGLRYLVASGMDAYVVQVLSAEEIEPELAGDLTLIDSEDEDRTEVTVGKPLIDRYKKTLAAHQASLRDFCSKRGITFIATGNQAPVEKLALTYLRERGLVR